MSTHPLILVTGASKGIGQAICHKLLAEGYHVVGIARQFQGSTLAHHPNFEGVSLDLSNLEALPQALKELKGRYPQVKGLICNAGRGHFKHLEEFSFEQIRSLIDLNFLSHVYLTKAFLPLLKKQTRSDVIFIGSEAALAGRRQGSVYCASKFALRGFAQALRDECATSSVRVCLINPGMVQTSFFQELHFSPGMEHTEHLLPEDIAETVALVLRAREGTVFDEINLSPHRKKICFHKKLE
jgi:NADP-dependent 3-hydroxy acid dehydrogenase YdfG